MRPLSTSQETEDRLPPLAPRNPSPRPTSKRVRQACLRCHKQKLKCDNERPCALCIRSNVECKENLSRLGRRRRGPTGVPSVDRSLASSLSQPGQQVYDTPRSTEAGSDSGLLSPSSIGVSEVPYQERPSAYGLVNNIFENYSSSAGVRSGASAIPDGTPKVRNPSSLDNGRVPVHDLVGIQLPCPAIVNHLLDSYLKSVHWFITVIHEPTFRQELDEILHSGTVPRSRISFLILVLVVLAFGSHYISDEVCQSLSPGDDHHSLEKRLLKTVERNFLDLFDDPDIEAVQAGLILSSYYAYFGQPRRGYVVLGAALTAGISMGLQRESMWGDIDPLSREIRRRTWWAVYAGDGFSAINFGRPRAINESVWEVKMVRNIDDTSITCPGFDSMETLEDGTRERVTILTYQRCKYKLYQIASTILRQIYFQKGATVHEIVKRVRAINERLIDWEKAVPPELKLRSYQPNTTSAELEENRVLRTFQLQALVLTQFYDNVQLLLHRPLLTYKPLSQTQRFKVGVVTLDTLPGHAAEADYANSKTQCFNSAMEASQIGEYRNLLLAARNTPVAPYLGMQTFTAGAVLGLFALSMPFTDIAQDAKRALGRLIKMPQSLGFHDLLSDQCANILKELVHLILSEEMRSLTANDEGNKLRETSDDRDSLRNLPTASPLAARSHLPPLTTTAEYNWVTKEPANELRPVSADMRVPYTANRNPQAPFSREDSFVAPEGPLDYPDGRLSVVPEVLNNAVSSLQHVFRDERVRTNGISWRDSSPYTSEENSGLTPFPTIPTQAPGPLNTEIAFDDTGQAWIWDYDFNFD